ncbi:DNA-3-methyladenine glycosylase I [Chitinasiproducens palmae]|uniref:DNA-3-methyladenine glycosylase I n=1 Tax=Chitinasiproducens palmae TaxID=1770053 RepID=A0A1H2PV09_9BURK|nr:DNA-3-methyladenine glycosylase I [Chitinasiproducens palmae]SDV50645.1 DNA-3-methyladenine glycosylase I [Chitinasiproducens palmae]
MDAHSRCAWAQNDPLMREYHDTEWGVPQRDARTLWENLMLEGFQAGLSWQVILHKRAAFRAAFEGFDPRKVARFGAGDVERLLADTGIVRSRAKIEATIRGARIFNEMQAGGDDFSDYCWSFVAGKPLRGEGTASQSALSVTVSKDLKRRGFKFVGPTIVYAWMQAVGLLNDHAATCFRCAPVSALAARRN